MDEQDEAYEKLMGESIMINASYEKYIIHVGIKLFPNIKKLNDYLTKFSVDEYRRTYKGGIFGACLISNNYRKETEAIGIICLPNNFTHGILAHEIYHAVTEFLSGKKAEDEVTAKLLGRLIDNFYKKINRSRGNHK